MESMSTNQKPVAILSPSTLQRTSVAAGLDLWESLLLLFCLCWGLLGSTQAKADEAQIGGSIEASIDGKTVAFPLLSSSVAVDIQGDLARVSVTQRFENPLGAPVNASYLFPLNKDAAVFALTMLVGNERVRAVIKEKEVAKSTFVKAQKEGKAAVLLTQHRPNMFTQQLANLMPGLPIQVVMEYTQRVPKLDQGYELVVPMVVGPRFSPDKREASETGGLVAALSQLPAAATAGLVDIPDSVDFNRVSLQVRLESAVGFLSVTSATHDIAVETVDGSTRKATLSPSTTLANRDFVLRYQLGSATDFSGGVLSHADDRGGFFSVMIEPPERFLDDQVLPREMVFLLDCSGSMSGAPMAASKAFMRSALQALRSEDRFRIIRFSDSATEFSSQPLQATRQNVAAGLRYTESLSGSGGTVMRSGIEQALMVPQGAGFVRQVVFLTDGYIGNEFAILRLVERELGDARLFALGVGTGVNRYLLDELARTGRGFARYLDPTGDVESLAASLATRLRTPLLTDILIDWGDMEPTEVTPQPLPDLYAGDSVRVQGRYSKPGRYPVRITGRSGGELVELPVDVLLSESVARDAPGQVIALLWARSAIKDAMHQLSIPQQLRVNEQSDEAIAEKVTALGLDYSLATRWTSFVAVSEQVVNPDPGLATDAQVPNAQVKGVSQAAYPNLVAPPTSAHGGYAAPEPSTWLGLGLLALMLMLWFGVAQPGVITEPGRQV